MSFNIALSGISASQKHLNTTANNIANVNTYGFKGSRAEFADVYASSMFSNSRTNTGGGVATSSVAQQFQQGSLVRTNNSLDMAISGNGFFVTSNGDGQDFNFTRAGAFKLNSENFIVDSAGNYLQTFPVDQNGASTSISLSTTQPLQVPDTAGNPIKSTALDIGMNLNAGDDYHDPANFDPDDPSTYNNSTSATIYDSLGNPHVMTTYFVRPEGGSVNGENQWVAFYAVDGKPVNVDSAGSYTKDDGAGGTTTEPASDGNGWAGAVVTFDDNGVYQGTNPANIKTVELGANGAGILGAGADGTQTLDINFSNPTQFAANFEVTRLSQNGQTVGRLTALEIGLDGLVKATYSNGSEVPLGRVALARFNNEQGLAQVGNSSWKASLDSGNALAGEAGSGTFGAINSASLEQANVDLTSELVDLISAQRNFQANSRSLEINNTLQQTILQIR
ncbi:flagellar hook protein FlgE [Paraferrimonas sedimenticola]|uniref:Flagellar hook protein FlgE n=1 Tax=Paraferrimonas sedimenticola TaxID=375674 RepID=A0AA37W0G7_9GAMM|nr:flagellar hook protein FlgE [Paraferrimonas sedimenticola]GLP94992.1 flagellar hook protein FlgE [Paraferrimonas sedimenticola]